jgi:hypothetical protein
MLSPASIEFRVTESEAVAGGVIGGFTVTITVAGGFDVPPGPVQVIEKV